MDHEQSKGGNHGTDGCPGAWQVYINTQAAFRALANGHCVFGKMLEGALAVPLQKFADETEKRLAEIDKNNKSGESVIGNAVSATNEARERCEKAILACKFTLEADLGVMPLAGNRNQNFDKKGGFSLLSISNMVSDAITTVKQAAQSKEAVFMQQLQEAKNASNAYKMGVVNSNKLLKHFYKTDMPAWQNDLQKMEEDRLRLLRDGIGSFSDILNDLVPKYQEVSKLISGIAESLDPSNELSLFLKSTVKNYSPAPAFLAYSLDAELEEILTKIMNNTYTPSTVGLMKNKKHSGTAGISSISEEYVCPLDESPTSRAKIAEEKLTVLKRSLTQFADKESPDACPPVIISLAAAVKGHLQTEGIFRISASGSDLENLREKVLKGEYEATNLDPYIPAALIKEILRADPLIHSGLYLQCIDYAKTIRSDESSPSVQLPAALEKILGQLKPLYRNTLFFICALMLRAADPINSLKSKMNLNNLAIVFSPGILRNPSLDPVSMLGNTKYECAFVIDLVKKLESSNSLPEY